MDNNIQIGKQFFLYLIMTEQTQILDLSSQSNIQILQAIQKLLEESQFSKFTLILTRKERKNDQPLAITMAGTHRRRTRYSVNTNSKNSKYGPDYNSKYSIQNKLQLDFDDEESNNNFDIALGYYNRSFFDNALELFLEQQKFLIENNKLGVNTNKEYQNVCFYIGNCYYRLKRYQQAIQYYVKKFQDQEVKQVGQKLNNLGSCYAKLDQLRLSLNYYADALKIYEKIPDFDCANLLNNIGVLYAQSSMFETGEKYFLQSIQQRKLKSPESQYLLYCSYYQLGNCQKNAKKYTQAISSLFNALQIAQRGIADQSQILIQLACIYEMSQKWSQALDCYEKLSLKATDKGFLFEKAAQLHRNMGHVSDYDRFIKKAYEQYTRESNQRKLSELLPVVSRLSAK